jgi:sigma-B regulation protein RsbU (phosphoserine phosphatase)
MPSDPVSAPAADRATVAWWQRGRQLLAGTRAGWLVLGGAAVKLVVFGVTRLTGPVGILDLFDTLGSLALIAGLAYFTYRGFRHANRRLLWRVRRKLIISYIFIGVFPVLLVISFFILTGLLLFLNVSSYLVASSLQNVAEEARFLAQTTVLEIQRGGGGESAAQPVLERKEAAIGSRYRGASMALVSTGTPPCGAPPGTGAGEAAPAGARAPGRPLVVAGPWAHVDPPRSLPAWVACSGFGGLVTYHPKEDAPPDTLDRPVAIRAVGLPEDPRPRYAVIVDIPLNDQVVERLRDDTSVKVNTVTVLDEGRAGAAGADLGRTTVRPVDLNAKDAAANTKPYRINWVMVVDAVDWATGRTRQAVAGIAVRIPDIYERLSAAQGRLRSLSLGSLFLALLLVIAGLFLVIEGVALVGGLALARSITGSIHSLFAGTERVRRGDFSHRIAVRGEDQLGELASSFNSMTSSIEDLLRQAEEKKRLEEELRIAREIQMSLLPRGHLAIPGLSVTALCVPAREVGGDYYDLIRLDDSRLGVLIADVSGKGTSAALYMAELKGIVLSLSKTSPSPRDLLVRANRIIRENLDSRSFITMTYAVIDLGARTMTYARAGHTPLMYRANGTAHGRVRVLAPEGMVLGLQIDDGRLFEALLQEETLPLGPGDLLLFFTDGISEAMNGASDCFGEARLGQIVEEHGDLPTEELRERILREIESFVDGAPQHDDMTLILLRVEPAARDLAAPRRAVAT